MRILVPDHYGDEDIEKIRAVSNHIEIARLSIQRKWNSFQGLLYRLLPLPLYNIVAPLITTSKPVYHLQVDGKKPNGQINDINILLSSWIINSDILYKLLPLLPNLRWIHSTMTGIDHLLCPQVIGNDNIQLTSSKGVHSKAIAEFVMALMMALIKRIPEHIYLQQKRKWQVLEADELTGKTVGIIGFGGIGREIAKEVRMRGMKVVAVKKSPINVDDVIVFPIEGLRELLKLSDFVIISAPLTRETFGIIGEAELKVMKRTAYLINISREEIVQKDTLIHALKQKWIAGACIDVFHQQPLPSNSQYYSLSNLIITHHSVYFTSLANKRIFNFFLDNLKRFIRGDELLGKVDKILGY